MRIRSIALVVGGACIVALGSMGVVACSSDDGTGTPTPVTQDANVATDTGAKADTAAPVTDAGIPETATGDDDSSPPSDAGTGADCAPTGALHPVEAGVGVYCPFSSVGDAGNLTCAFGEHCLEPSSGTSVCSASASTADAGTDWECQGPENCPTGNVCCAQAATAGQDPGCGYHFLSKFKGTTCRTSCQAGEITACESVAACTAVTGTSCQITHAKGATFGLCL